MSQHQQAALAAETVLDERIGLMQAFVQLDDRRIALEHDLAQVERDIDETTREAAAVRERLAEALGLDRPMRLDRPER